MNKKDIVKILRQCQFKNDSTTVILLNGKLLTITARKEYMQVTVGRGLFKRKYKVTKDALVNF